MRFEVLRAVNIEIEVIWDVTLCDLVDRYGCQRFRGTRYLHLHDKYLPNNTPLRANSFNYLGYTVTVTNNRDLEIKMHIFNRICGTIQLLNKRTRKETQITFIKLLGYRYLHMDPKFGVFKNRKRNSNCRSEIFKECGRLHKKGPIKKY
jgi:hypothetical protein